jgi:hypothetical protein
MDNQHGNGCRLCSTSQKALSYTVHTDAAAYLYTKAQLSSQITSVCQTPTKGLQW